MSTTQRSNPREHVLSAFVADLELELDVLRKQAHFVQQTVADSVDQIQLLCAARSQPIHPDTLDQIERVARELNVIVHDLQAEEGKPVSHDEVAVMEVRPLVEQIFRWQQRLQNAPYAMLLLELKEPTIKWFPARLRHILENMISNALKYRDQSKGETRLSLAFNSSPSRYEFRLTDNGLGMPSDNSSTPEELFHRSSPSRSAAIGVGLAVVKVLVEQTGGTMETYSSRGQGSSFVVTLPRFELNDFVK